MGGKVPIFEMGKKPWQVVVVEKEEHPQTT